MRWWCRRPLCYIVEAVVLCIYGDWRTLRDYMCELCIFLSSVSRINERGGKDKFKASAENVDYLFCLAFILLTREAH